MKKHTFYYDTIQEAEWFMRVVANLYGINQKSIQVEYRFIWWMLSYKHVVTFYSIK